MGVLPDTARAVLESDALAHLVTLNPDGSPQVSIVWVGLDGDDIVSAHLAERQKLRNVRRDPRVAISLASGETNALGLREYLVVHGNATVEEGGAPELLQLLAHTYLGPDVTFPAMPDPPPIPSANHGGARGRNGPSTAPASGPSARLPGACACRAPLTRLGAMALRTAVSLTGDDLTLADVWAVAVEEVDAELAEEGREKLRAARELVIASRDPARASTRTGSTLASDASSRRPSPGSSRTSCSYAC